MLVSLGITIIISPLSYWLQPKLQKRFRHKLLKKEIFQTFIQKHQFKILDEGYIIGKIEDYIVLLHPKYDDFQYSKYIQIQVLFNPKRKGDYIPSEFIYRMIRKYNKKNVTWHINSVLIQQPYGFTLPKYKVLYPLLKRCISELKANDISPISYKEWQEMIPKTQHYLDTLQNK